MVTFVLDLSTVRNDVSLLKKTYRAFWLAFCPRRESRRSVAALKTCST
jgi:hypothetical protein